MQMANFLKTLTTNLKAYFQMEFQTLRFSKSGLYILFVIDTLVCAPTGSVKLYQLNTAIDHFTKLGKKVIYTTPIKALSNDKTCRTNTKISKFIL